LGFYSFFTYFLADLLYFWVISGGKNDFS